MNYQMLKGIMDSLVKNFKCESCDSHVNDVNIYIVGAAGNTLNLDIECPSCHKHNMVRAEISNINLGPLNDLNQVKSNLIKSIKNLSNLKHGKEKIGLKIDEREIIDLRKKLNGNNINVGDILSQ